MSRGRRRKWYSKKPLPAKDKLVTISNEMLGVAGFDASSGLNFLPGPPSDLSKTPIGSCWYDPTTGKLLVYNGSGVTQVAGYPAFKQGQVIMASFKADPNMYSGFSYVNLKKGQYDEAIKKLAERVQTFSGSVAITEEQIKAITGVWSPGGTLESQEDASS